MTQSENSRPGLLAAMTVSAALALSASAARAEVLVARAPEDASGAGSSPGTLLSTAQRIRGDGGWFEPYDGGTPVPQKAGVSPQRETSRVPARGEVFLQHYGIATVLMFAGYYSPPAAPGQAPSPNTPTVVPPPPPPKITDPRIPPPPPTPRTPPKTITSISTPGSPQPPEMPEPATLLSGLLGVGTLGLYALRRRRKKAQ
jgi:MYXO-CTERM domain-containing protein